MANGPAQPPWRRVVGDKPQHTWLNNLTVRKPGPRQWPPRNSPALEYFLLLSRRRLLRNTRWRHGGSVTKTTTFDPVQNREISVNKSRECWRSHSRKHYCRYKGHGHCRFMGKGADIIDPPRYQHGPLPEIIIQSSTIMNRNRFCSFDWNLGMPNSVVTAQACITEMVNFIDNWFVHSSYSPWYIHWYILTISSLYSIVTFW